MTPFESPARPQFASRSWEVEAGVRLAHRLRTPLATVKSAAQLIQRLAMDPEEAASYLLSIVQAVDRMSGCIERFEQLLQIEIPSGTCTAIRLAAEEAASATVETTRIHHASVSVSGSHVSTAPLPHWALVEVISELVRNAAVHGGGGVAIAVSWDATPAGGCRLKVEDSGGGVPEEVADRILQPYFSTVDHHPGIGLTRVGRIVRQAGGSLVWDNLPEGGCRFVVEFEGGSDGAVSHRRG